MTSCPSTNPYPALLCLTLPYPVPPYPTQSDPTLPICSLQYPTLHNPTFPILPYYTILPISCRYPSSTQPATLPYRTQPYLPLFYATLTIPSPLPNPTLSYPTLYLTLILRLTVTNPTLLYPIEPEDDTLPHCAW